MDKFTSKVFTSSGSFVTPAGVTKVLVYGMGGGSGGAAGTTGSAGSGGRGGRGGDASSLQPIVLDVVPNTTYTITIGAGGTGGVASANPGGSGGDSSFGALMTWKGAPGGSSSNAYNNTSYLNNYKPYSLDFNFQYDSPRGGATGTNGSSTNNRQGGYPGYIGRTASAGTYTGSSTGGANGGSGMSGEDIGGTGGQGVNANIGGAGGNAPANSGAGGGGGAGGGSTTKAAGAGGNGGSGKIIVMWVE